MSDVVLEELKVDVTLSQEPQKADSLLDSNAAIENELLTFYSSCLPKKDLRLPDNSEESDNQEETKSEKEVDHGEQNQDSQINSTPNTTSKRSKRCYLSPLWTRRNKRWKYSSVNSTDVQGGCQTDGGLENMDRKSPSDCLTTAHTLHRVTGISSNTELAPLAAAAEAMPAHRRTLSWSSMTSHDLSRLDGIDFRTIISEQGMSDGEGDTVHRARSFNLTRRFGPRASSRSVLGSRWNIFSQNPITVRICSFVGSNATLIHPVFVYLLIIFGSALIHYMLDNPETVRNKIEAIRKGIETYQSNKEQMDPEVMRELLLQSVFDLKDSFHSQSNETWATLEGAFNCQLDQDRSEPVIVYLLGFVQAENTIRCLAERIGHVLKDSLGDKMVHWLDLSQIKDDQLGEMKTLMRAVFLDVAMPHGDVIIVNGIQYVCSDTMEMIFNLVNPQAYKNSNQLFVILTGSISEDSLPYCFRKKSFYVSDDVKRLFELQLDVTDLALFKAKVIHVIEEKKTVLVEECGSRLWKTLYKILSSLSVHW